MRKDLVLVDMNLIDQGIYSEFYPRISHKQRQRLLQCMRRNAVLFEDETSQDLMGMNQEEFEKLTEEQKFIAYENMVEMFVGSQAELEEQQEIIAQERQEVFERWGEKS